MWHLHPGLVVEVPERQLLRTSVLVLGVVVHVVVPGRGGFTVQNLSVIRTFGQKEGQSLVCVEGTLSRLKTGEKSSRAASAIATPGSENFHAATEAKHQAMAFPASSIENIPILSGHVRCKHDLEAHGPSRHEGNKSDHQSLSGAHRCWERRAR